MTELDPTTTPPPEAQSESGEVAEPRIDRPFESTLEGAPAAPVTSEAVRRRPIRWPIAVGLIALVVAVSALVGILITGRAPDARILGYVPDGTIAYGEARLDLPGDQRLALASFLSKFPGFADQAAIEGKLNEVMDRFVGGVTNGDQTYTTDIQPWFDGELGFALGQLPDPATLSGGGAPSIDSFRYLLLVSVKDQAGVTAWFKGIATKSGVTMADQAYGGATLTTLTDAGHSAAYAVVDGRVAVVGDLDSVKAAIDTQGKGPFAAQASPRAAIAALDSSHVGFMYIDVAALVDWSGKAAQAGGSSITPGLDFSSSALRGMLPGWEGLALRVEGDAIVLETALNRPASAIGPTDNRTSTLTDHVPSSALLMGVGHDAGKTLLDTLAVYESEPSLKSAIDSIKQGAGILGGLDGAVGWIGDAGYVVNQANGGIEGGIVIVPNDQAAAARTFTGLRTLLSLAGTQAGLTISDEPYAGTSITTIDLGDIAALIGRAGVSPEMLGPGVTLPTGHVTLAYAVGNGVVVIGSSPDFVKHVLDTTVATSIASTDRYKALIGRIGNGTGVTFIDIAAIRGLLESAMAGADPSAMTQYEQEVKPFLAPFDALIEGSSVKDDVAGGKLIVTVK